MRSIRVCQKGSSYVPHSPDSWSHYLKMDLPEKYGDSHLECRYGLKIFHHISQTCESMIIAEVPRAYVASDSETEQILMVLSWLVSLKFRSQISVWSLREISQRIRSGVEYNDVGKCSRAVCVPNMERMICYVLNRELKLGMA